MKLYTLPFASCLFLLSTSASAESIPCQNVLKGEGASRYEVQSACGEPQDKMQRVEYRTVRDRVGGPCPDGQGQCSSSRARSVEVIVDEWIYDHGSNKFLKHVIFEQGKLVEIRRGNRAPKN